MNPGHSPTSQVFFLTPRREGRDHTTRKRVGTDRILTTRSRAIINTTIFLVEGELMSEPTVHSEHIRVPGPHSAGRVTRWCVPAESPTRSPESPTRSPGGGPRTALAWGQCTCHRDWQGLHCMPRTGIYTRQCCDEVCETFVSVIV